MVLRTLMEAGWPGYLAVVLGGLGAMLGVLALVLAFSRNRAGFGLGIAALVLALLTAGAGMGGTLRGRRLVNDAIASVGSAIDGERIARQGNKEAQGASLIGFFAALLPVGLGALGALAGSRVPSAPSRTAGLEANVSTDASSSATTLASVFIAMAGLAVAGAWVMAHRPLPELRYAIPDDDYDGWSLAAAMEAVDTQGTRACARFDEQLRMYWNPTDATEWPRVMRRPVPEALTWKKTADRCVTDALAATDSREWTSLETSVLLQDEQLRAVLRQRLSPPPADDKVPAADPSETQENGAQPDREVIRRVIARSKQRIQFCYERALTKNPKLAGTVVIEFAISPEGTVSRAKDASPSPLADANAVACMLDVMKRLTFPAPGFREVVVKYPFVFRSE